MCFLIQPNRPHKWTITAAISRFSVCLFFRSCTSTPDDTVKTPPSDHFQSIHQVPRGPVVWEFRSADHAYVYSQLMAWVFSVMIWSLCAMRPFWPFCYIPKTPWLYQKIRIPWISSSSIKLGFFLRPVWGELKLKTFLLVCFIQLLL